MWRVIISFIHKKRINALKKRKKKEKVLVGITMENC